MERNHVVDEAEVLGDKIKCLQSYESFKAVKEKLLQSASEALKYMPSKAKGATDRKSILEEEDGDLTIPAKRARMAHNLQEGSSPGVQVFIITRIKCNVVINIFVCFKGPCTTCK